MIAILIPVYNGDEFLENALRSVANQTIQHPLYVLIAFNGPERVSLHASHKSMIESFQSDRIHIHAYESSQVGKPAVMNEMARHLFVKELRWYCILDVDDEWLPGKLQTQFFIAYTSRYDVIGTLCEYFGDSTGRPTIPTGDITNFDFLSVNPVINSSVMFRSSICKQYLWSSKFTGLDDYDLWIRLWKAGYTFFNIHKVLTRHRIHKDSAFNSKPQPVTELRQYYSKI